MFLLRFVLAIAASVFLYACGGGGGSSPTPVVVVTPTPIVVPVMTCANNAIWSNPAVFSAVFQDCVAPIGVQALVTPSLNTMTDASCTPTVGILLSASCRAYMANGTILIANTSVIVQNNPTVWFAYVSADGKSNLVLLDTVAMAPIGTMVLSGPLAWLIGNPTGVNVDVADVTLSAGLLRNEQITWNGASFTVTCHSNC